MVVETIGAQPGGRWISLLVESNFTPKENVINYLSILFYSFVQC